MDKKKQIQKRENTITIPMKMRYFINRDDVESARRTRSFPSFNPPEKPCHYSVTLWIIPHYSSFQRISRITAMTSSG